MDEGRVPTLADLEREGQPLQIWCNRCKRRVERDAGELCRLLGPETPIYGVWRRLRCVECGARGRGDRGDVYSMPLGPKNDRSTKFVDPLDPNATRDFDNR